MGYIYQRLVGLVRNLSSPRGLIVVLAVVATTASLFLDGTARKVALGIALLLLAAAVLLMSLRQSEQHARLQTLQKTLAEAQQNIRNSGGKVRPAQKAASKIDYQAERRLDSARDLISSIRAEVGLADIDPTSVPHEPPPSEQWTEGAPVLTIVVALYNEDRFVGEALRSLQNQSLSDWECIIVDDASTDRSLAEAWRYASADKRIRVIRHKVNSGLPSTRNTGLRAARGYYVGFLDADDMFMSDNLLERVEAMGGAGPEVAGSYSGVRITPEDVTLESLPAHAHWGEQPVIDFVTANSECPFNAHAPLLRTAIVRDHGGFDETMLHGAEDWDLWLRIMRSGYVFKPSEHRTAIYRQKASSMAKAMAFEHVSEARRLIAASHQPAPPSSAKSAEFPFPEPLPTYQQKLVTCRRAIQFAATSLLGANLDAAKKILDELPDGYWPLIERHIDLNDTITTGFRRAIGLTHGEADTLTNELSGLRRRAMEMVKQGSSGNPEQKTRAARPAFDIAFAPQDAAQATLMLDAARTLGPDRSVAFILTERISGKHGAAEVVDQEAYAVFSLDRWALSGASFAALVVAFPYAGALEKMCGTAETLGAEVFHLRMPGNDTLRSGDSPPSPAVAFDPGELKVALADAALANHAILASPNAFGPLLWPPSDDDPDQSFAIEEYPDNYFDADDLSRFKDIHRGERCFIIGNGPSLNKLDLTQMAGERTIGVNGIFYAADQMGFDLTYYAVEDTMVVRDNLEAIKEYEAGHKFFPTIYRDKIGEASNVSYFMMNRGFYATTSPAYCVPRFSTDPTQRVYSGQSVTIMNLQLAYFMGFEEVVVIGMDFSYTVPDDSKVDGNHILSMGDDPNHFHPDYFGKGKVWKDPKLDRVLANYQLAKNMYEADGRRILNATAGGKLELFPRVDYDSLFD